MESPASVELTVPQVRDIAQKMASFKGKPPERVKPRKIMEAIKALPEMPDLPRFREEEEAAQKGLEAASTPEEKREAEKAMAKTRQEFQAAYSAWVAKPVFLPIDRPERAFIWSLFAKEFQGEITTGREDEIEGIAKALGQSGAMEDLFAAALEDSEKAEKDEEEPVAVKPELVK